MHPLLLATAVGLRNLKMAGEAFERHGRRERLLEKKRDNSAWKHGSDGWGQRRPL